MRLLEARERRAIAWGAAVAAGGMVLAFVVAPFVRAALDRASAIGAEEVRVGRLRALSQRGAELQQTVGVRTRELESGGVRLVAGRAAPLAAAALQSLLQEYARMSRVSVTRLDVAADVDSTSAAAQFVPATLSAVGDIYGLAELLGHLRSGAFLLEVRELTVSSTSALRGDLLQLTLGVRAPWIPAAGGDR